MASTKSAAAKVMERIKDVDLYLLLDVDTDASQKAIKKAYRKKARTCHPDKNPDNPKAAEEFHRLSDALEVLSDEAARKAYDNVLKARKANELRNRELDSKRRKLKDALEEREREARDDVGKKHEAEGTAEEQEIRRLRKRGRAMLVEEEEREKSSRFEYERAMKEWKRTMADIPEQSGGQNMQRSNGGGSNSKKLKVKWKNDSEGRYTKVSLKKIFDKYGDVAEVVANEGRKGSGIVEMALATAAEMASKYETGFAECPLKLKLLEGDPGMGGTSGAAASAPASSSTTPLFSADVLSRETDFESLVMRKLRQEEERKRLIRVMEEEDDEKDDEN
jgi:DnaJ family protein C protein 17